MCKPTLLKGIPQPGIYTPHPPVQNTHMHRHTLAHIYHPIQSGWRPKAYYVTVHVCVRTMDKPPLGGPTWMMALDGGRRYGPRPSPLFPSQGTIATVSVHCFQTKWKNHHIFQNPLIIHPQTAKKCMFAGYFLMLLTYCFQSWWNHMQNSNIDIQNLKKININDPKEIAFQLKANPGVLLYSHCNVSVKGDSLELI